MATPPRSLAYPGPQCPFCEVALPEDQIRSGVVECWECLEEFSATAFTPVEKTPRITEVIATGPEGTNACANHARNAAVTSCERCGLFICSLCDMNVGEGSVCPSCFDRARREGNLQTALTRVRNYGGMARATVIFGLLLFTFLGIPLGALSIYYCVKAIKQRRAEGDSIAGMVLVMVLAVLEILGSVAFIGVLIAGGMS